MGVGGISSYGTGGYYNYQTTLNQVRLQQALSKNSRFQQTVQPVQSVNPSSSAFGSSSMDFLKSYSSTMTDYMQSSNELREINRGGVMNDLSVSSSDTAVAEAVERYPARVAKDITLDVTQIASAQVNSSDGVRGSAAAESSMDFSVIGNRGNAVSVSVDKNFEDGSTKSNRQMLKEAAAQINSKSEAGVKAFVEDKDGVSTLRIQGTKTGKDNSFSVTGSLGAAEGLDSVKEAAQDAIYTVTENGRTADHTSSTNNVKLDNARIGLTLKSAGEATISAGADNEKIFSAVEDLIESHNNALELLKDNASRGSGVTEQLKSMVRGLASDQTLEKVGIDTKKDGTLTLDKDKLKKSLKEDPKLTRDILGGSSSVAQTGFDKASQGLRKSASSLLGNELNTYSRTGGYSMSGFSTLGYMMNYLI